MSEIIERLHEINENLVTIGNPLWGIPPDRFDSAIIGVTADNNHVVYSYELLIENLMKDDDMSRQEALDWIEYNIMPMIPNTGEYAPIVIEPLV